MPTILSPIGVDQMANHKFFFYDLDKRKSTMVGAKKLERLEVRLDGCCRGRDVGGPLPKSCALGHYAGSYPGYRRCLVFYCVYCCSYLHSLEAMLISESE